MTSQGQDTSPATLPLADAHRAYYGREKLSLELPDDLEVTAIRKRAMSVPADPVAAIRKALQDPIAGRSDALIAG
ncbi:MAG: hypothetical protein JO232_05660 [Verrucomicrobia bacterium]|nr:hypothetical protein [Verrucomicrobiota bacterium]